MTIRELKRCVLILMFAAFSSQCWAWGTKGHETIEVVAARLLPNHPLAQLIKNNIDAVKFLSMVPDLSWKHGAELHPTEGQAHFFQIDFYSPRGGALNPHIEFYIERVGDPALLLKKGTAPWRMEQMSALFAKTLRKPNVSPEEVLQVAATLGHYVGDLGNPLHVSKDFDGQSIGQRGLHSFFETESVNAFPDEQLLNAVYHSANLYIGRMPKVLVPIHAAFGLSLGANKQSKVVLATAVKAGQTPKFQEEIRPVIVSTLAMSAAVLAKIWDQAYRAAGQPALKTKNVGKVPVPPWVPVNYIHGVHP